MPRAQSLLTVPLRFRYAPSCLGCSAGHLKTLPLAHSTFDQCPTATAWSIVVLDARRSEVARGLDRLAVISAARQWSTRASRPVRPMSRIPLTPRSCRKLQC